MFSARKAKRDTERKKISEPFSDIPIHSDEFSSKFFQQYDSTSALFYIVFSQIIFYRKP